MLFKDRINAGQLLAKNLLQYANRADVLVLALPRGGVPVGFEVAKALNAPLDVLPVRKLGVPGQKELAMGALAPNEIRVLNRDVVRNNRLFSAAVHQVTVREQRELERQEHLFRDGRPALNAEGRIVILVDDGLATGATMRAAIRALQQRHPARIVVAVPVSSPETYDQIAAEVDEVVVVQRPSPFYSVGLWYKSFTQVTDEEVCDLLKQSAEGYQHSTSVK